MSQSEELIHYSYQIKDDLWFNFVPITSETRKFYKRSEWYEATKRVSDGAGFGSYFVAISKYFEYALDNPKVHLYSFLATHNQFKGGNPLEYKLEMAWAVTIDEKSHIWNHMGAQKYEIENPHPKISVLGHAFCANMVKFLYPDVSIMIFSPVPIMRHLIWEELKKHDKKDSLCIEWWHGKMLNSINPKDKGKTLEDKLDTIQKGQAEVLAKGEALPMHCKAVKSYYEILVYLTNQEFECSEYFEGSGYLKCPDGAKAKLEHGLPDWFEKNTECSGAQYNANTYISMNGLSSMFPGFNPAKIQKTIEILGSDESGNNSEASPAE